MDNVLEELRGINAELGNDYKRGIISYEIIQKFWALDLFSLIENSLRVSLKKEHLKHWDEAQKLVPHIEQFFREENISVRNWGIVVGFYRDQEKVIPHEIISNELLRQMELETLLSTLPSNLPVEKRRVLMKRIKECFPHWESSIKILKEINNPTFLEMEKCYYAAKILKGRFSA